MTFSVITFLACLFATYFVSIVFFSINPYISTSKMFFIINSRLLLSRESSTLLFRYLILLWQNCNGRLSYFITNWILSTNHRRIAVMYFVFTIITGFTGLILATVIRLELAYPGHGFLNNNSEKYLTITSLHAVVMVFFVVIPILFGAFGNFLLPTQLGIRDVAFPRLNSFMFWITPAGFVLLLHIIIFDKSYHLTYWLGYSELKAQLKRKYQHASAVDIGYHVNRDYSLLASRLATFSTNQSSNVGYSLLGANTPKFFKNTNLSFPHSFKLIDLFSAPAFLLSLIFSNVHSAGLLVIRILLIFWKNVASCCEDLTEVVGAAFNYAAMLLNHQLLLVKQLFCIAGLHCVFASGYDFYNVAYRTIFLTGGYTNTLTMEDRLFLLLINSKLVNLRFFDDTTTMLLNFKLSYQTHSNIITPISYDIRGYTLFDLTRDLSFILQLALLDYPHYAFFYKNDVYNLGEFYQLSTRISFERAVHRWEGFCYQQIAIFCQPAMLFSEAWQITYFPKICYNLVNYCTTFMFDQIAIPVRVLVECGIADLAHGFFSKIVQNVIFFIFYARYGFELLLVKLLSPAFNSNQFLLFEGLSFSLFYNFFYAGVSDIVCFSIHQGTLASTLFRFFRALLLSVSLQWDFFLHNRVLLAGLCGDAVAATNKNLAHFTKIITTDAATVTKDVDFISYLVSNVSTNKLHTILPGNTAEFMAINTNALVWNTAYLQQYYYKLLSLDYLNDWRCLKFEREIWRSIDNLSLARKHWISRSKFYSSFYSPVSIINKVSIWMPNHLIPGWAYITPYTSRLRYTSLGKVDVSLVVILVASTGSVFSAINYVITYRYIGAPTFKNRKELRSFFVDALLVGSRMMIVANPALIIGILLLLSDRHFNTSVFDFSGGGDTVLFQHLFWFFGHPEVYIVIIPCFGIMNSLLPYYLRKRLSGRLSLQFSMYTIAFMSFAVWGHHMYMVGLANSVRTLYSTGTVMISVPASTKILHWCVTIIQSSLSCDVGFLFLLAFMYFFVLGGLSGMFVAHLGFDVIFHDTFYVIGHFHVMFACSAMCCVFAGFYFYFSSIFGVRYSRFFAYLHFIFFVVGQLITIIPMMFVGWAGMPRRIMDYPSIFGGWQSVVSSGHLLIVFSFIFFFCMLLDSVYENKAPVSRTKGVSRLNTRLAFFAYEIRKLKYFNGKSQNLLKGGSLPTGNSQLYKLSSTYETTSFEYIFKNIK